MELFFNTVKTNNITYTLSYIFPYYEKICFHSTNFTIRALVTEKQRM